MRTFFFFNLSSISTMLLPQINCNKFFFILFRQCNCYKFIPTIFFPQFRQWHCHKPTEIHFFLSYFGNAIATIPFHFFLSKNMINQTVLVKKKYWKNTNMRTFFYISPLFRQCHCHKQQIFFSNLFKFIPTFFFPQFWQWHCHKLCTFCFLFLFIAL